MNENEGAVDRLAIQLARMEARMDVKLDQLLTRDDDHETRIRQLEQRAEPPHQEHTEQLADHETRIRAQEKWRWQVVGALAAAGVLGGGAGASVAAALLGLGGA